MVSTETLKTVFLVLFGLSVLWLVVIIVKNDMQTIVRALVVTAVFGLSLYYLNQTKLEQISFSAVKDDLFPPRTRNYSFERREGFIAGSKTFTFIFHDPGPPIALTMESGGKYMSIKDIRPINQVLAFLNLPPVAEGVPELASLTGSSLDTDKYRWDDYERGVLLIERGICRDMTTAQSFPCISRLTLRER